MLAVTGITNKSPRALMTGLLDGTDYSMNQVSYDLTRLRTNKHAGHFLQLEQPDEVAELILAFIGSPS
ncbi:hypothetical protein I546_0330 [Mycobacterium kansasii 732]|uniref:Uncharacterized protein n=1 Tax=Mycobacterium pseudokansasii TaxID=2341080 RepID=A0A498QPG0_9MYCO|nr:alpha/beta hydrolase [Mycobacterium pseudokansasii]EUA14719.1 hypothetical protein I546_0330 [Mycobacterium kansasii 732]KZS64654.1 hypothetical protein A4G27_19325 [Mycobacterium kansasii]MBY0387217.1 alpha/beta hydrolase [Mycobacterium pseudokansasii]VAZ90322.1 hypothetical protein LAUMK35_01237 [Mycobacterium pseudokansasii]VAZ91188.1 hypothetical protein LAUMK21_01237 [Mycobacterium pseudokansasii]